MGRVLIVDDEAPIRETLEECLEGMGFRTVSAPNGEDALRLMSEERPDFLILDVRMPGLGGLDVLRLSRALHPGLPVVMITGYADDGLAREAMRMGASDFFLKPFDPIALASRLTEGLSSPNPGDSPPTPDGPS